jgi:hypothetical protein
MTHDEFRDQLTELFEGIRDGENLTVKLEACLKAITKDEPEEFYVDMHEDFSLWINDAEWRGDYVGDEAIQNGKVFELVYKYACPFNEDLEVVLASSPYCPQSVLKSLLDSTYMWEEDGTTQALARTQSDPKVLHKLATNEDGSTRFYVADNPSTSAPSLDLLSADNGISESLSYMYNYGDDPDRFSRTYIRYAVAQNPNTSVETLERMLDQIESGNGITAPEYAHPDGFKEAMEFIAKAIKSRLSK